MTRDEMVKELMRVKVGLSAYPKGIRGAKCYKQEELFGEIADLILSREKAILDEIEKPLKKINQNWDGYVFIADDHYAPPRNFTRVNLLETINRLRKTNG